MHRKLSSDADQIVKRNKQRRGWSKIVKVMACAVVFCTTYALILPAITMEKDCEIEEHTHSEKCYSQITSYEAQKSICTYETLGVHQHSPECYDAEKNLQCGYGDFLVHTHGSECYAGESLICQLPEVKAHTHTQEECYQVVETEPAHVHEDSCYTLERGEQTCTLEEIAGHAHGDACYQLAQTPQCGLEEKAGHTHGDTCSETILICELSTEPAHTHTESCYTRQLSCGKDEVEGYSYDEETSVDVLICENAEEGHTHEAACYRTDVTVTTVTVEGHAHSDSCYAMVLTCGQSDEAHVHGDACYQTNRLCDLTEEPGHTHQRDCYDPQLICEIEETEGHTHTDSCYEQKKVLTCELPEADPAEEPAEPEYELVCEKPEIVLHTHESCVQGCTQMVIREHIHDETCFITEVIPLDTDALTCTNTEPDHIHTDFCYGTWVLSCGKEEHSHTEECMPELTATYYCGQEPHTHGEDCTDESGTQICTLVEHTHTDACTEEPQPVVLDHDGAVVSELTYTGLRILRNEEAGENTEENIVKPNETVFFDFYVNTDSYDETVYQQGRVKLEVVLPYGPEQAEFDLMQMPWLDCSEGYAAVITSEEQLLGEETVVIQKLIGYYQLRTDNWDAGVIPGEFTAAVAVKVLDIPHKGELSVAVSAAMEHNTWGGVCETHQIEEVLTIASDSVTVHNFLSEEEQQKIFDDYMAQLEELKARYEAGEDVLSEGEALQMAVLESYDKGEISEERFTELDEQILELLEQYYRTMAEAAVGTVWKLLRDRGRQKEHSDFEPMLFRSLNRTATNTLYEALNDVKDPSDIQVDAEGGTQSDEKVTISKTINGTDLENVFDITLTVATQEEIVEIIQEPDMAVVIVMDISQTMNSAFGGATRYEAALASAKDFLDKFAEETGGVSKVGYVAFNSNARKIFDLQACSNTQQAETLKAKMEEEADSIIYNYHTDSKGNVDDPTRFTNVEAGLKMGYDMLAGATNENKYIIFLSDGFPTTYIESGYIGYDTYCSSGTVGTDGVFYDSVTNKYCLYGTSYSDKAAIRASQQAARIKNAGAKIFSIGIDVGSQTIEGYERDPANSFSIIDRTGSTYEIGDASSTSAYKTWLGNSIGSGYDKFYYDSTDSSGLQAAYDEIFEEIQSMNAAAAEADWVAEDPMPVVNDVNYVEFLGFYDKSGNLVDGDLAGTSASGGENTAVYEAASTTIDWDLKKSGYTKTTSGSVSTYAYKLIYRVRLKNELAPFAEGAIYNTNATTSLSYNTFENVNGNITVSDDKTLYFPIPSVHGYLSELTFQKKDPFDRAVEGAEFTLTHDTANCKICRGDGTTVSVPTQVAVSDAEGKVTFTRIPSGHKYTLVETKVPEGYSSNGETYSVTVAYDTLTVAARDREGNTVEWTYEVINNTAYELPNTGGTGTYLYTAGGLLITAMVTLLYIHNQWRRKEETPSF